MYLNLSVDDLEIEFPEESEVEQAGLLVAIVEPAQVHGRQKLCHLLLGVHSLFDCASRIQL